MRLADAPGDAHRLATDLEFDRELPVFQGFDHQALALLLCGRPEAEMDDLDERGFAEPVAGVFLRRVLRAVGPDDVQPSSELHRLERGVVGSDASAHAGLPVDSKPSSRVSAPTA